MFEEGTAMRTVRFGRTNTEVSAVGFGTWPFTGPKQVNGQAEGWSGHDDGLASRALARAYQLGITHWDTADVYGAGNAERLIRSVWRLVPREAIFLASKVGWERGPYKHFYHPKQMRHQMEATLRHLGVDRVELYYLHHCDFGKQDEYLDGAVEMMQRFRAEGKIRFVGLSDWDSKRILRYIKRVDPDAVQLSRNVLEDTYALNGLKELVEARDLGVAFFSPLKHGVLLGKYEKPHSFVKGDIRSRISVFHNREFLAIMRRNRDALIKRFHDRPEPVLHGLLGTLWADAPAASVLLGQRNPSQVEAAASTGEPLSPMDTEWVKNLYKLAHQ